MRDYWVYMLRCSDGSYYVGVTNDVHRRFEEHVAGMNPGCYTFERRPLELVYAESFRDIMNAISYEKIVKAWSRKKKEALIRGDYEALRLHSKKKFPARFKRKCQKRIAANRSLVRNSLREFLLGMTKKV